MPQGDSWLTIQENATKKPQIFSNTEWLIFSSTELGEATETQVTDSIWFNRRYPSMPIPHLIHHLCCKLRNCRLPHSAVTPSDHRSAIKVPFYWATCCCNEKWRKVAIWIIRLVRFPSQCCSLQMVPMPVSSQCHDQRCRQGGQFGQYYSRAECWVTLVKRQQVGCIADNCMATQRDFNVINQSKQIIYGHFQILAWMQTHYKFF